MPRATFEKLPPIKHRIVAYDFGMKRNILRRLRQEGFQVQVVPMNNDGPGINLVIGDASQVAASQYQVKEPSFDSSDPGYVMLPGMTYTWRVRTTPLTTPISENDPGWSDWATGTIAS